MKDIGATRLTIEMSSEGRLRKDAFEGALDKGKSQKAVLVGLGIILRHFRVILQGYFKESISELIFEYDVPIN